MVMNPYAQRAGINPFAMTGGLPQQPKPLFQQNPPKSDTLANALMQSAYAEAPKSPFDAIGKLAMLWSGKRQQDRYIQGLEEKSAAEKQAELEQYKTFAGAFGDNPLMQKAIESNNLDLIKALVPELMKGQEPDYGFMDVDGTVIRTDKSAGTVEPVYGAPAEGAPAPLFKGNSVEAQALNGLVEAGKLTPEQAMQLGAGKTITGPQGQIIFMTPEGVFAKPADEAVPTDGKDGELPANPGLIPLTGNKTEGTEGQMTAGLYADRLTASNDIISSLEQAGTSLADTALSKVPIAGNYLISEDFQKLDQAKRNFINASLRRESGAVISDEEFANGNLQYFPQPGDSEATIKQKRANREMQIAGFQRAAGPRYKKPTIVIPEGGTGLPPDVEDALRKYGQ